MLVNIFDGVWNNGYLVDGGRNLFKHSSLVGEKLLCDSITHCNSVTSAKYEDTGYHLVTPSDDNSNNGIAFTFSDYTSLGLKRGDEIIFSADIKGTSDSHRPFIRIWLPSNSVNAWWVGSASIGTSFTPTDIFQRLRVAFTIPSSTETLIEGSILFGVHGDFQSDLYVRNLKLERGSIATDWTPAPEDTFDEGTAHPNSIFTGIIPVKKNTQYVYGLPNQNSLPAHTVRYMKSDGTWVKAVHQNEDTSSGVKTLTFDDDYNVEIMFQNGLSNEQKSNFRFKEKNNMAIKSADQITIIDVTDAYSVMLTSEAYTFIGGTGGVGANQSCVTEAVAFCGQNQCASVSVDQSKIVCPTGISAAVANSGTSKVKITFTTTATINAACEATIPVVVDGITMNKKFSFAVARTGNTGATGKGIKSTVVDYAASASNTTVPTSGWSTTIPSVTQGQYLWTRTTINYTDDTSTVGYSVAKQGATGAAGADAISLTITSSNGTVFKNNSGSTTLTAHVWKGSIEQTISDAGVVSGLGSIKWYKAGSDTAIATAKTLTVSANDVTNSQAYTCQLEG